MFWNSTLRESLNHLLRQFELLISQLRMASRKIPTSSQAGTLKLESQLRRYARPLRRITITRKSDGGATVALESDKSFNLPPALAKLLIWIAGDPAKDGIPRYKSINDTQLALDITRRETVNNSICRLRRVLDVNDRNPFLIDTSKEGVRLLALQVIVIDD